MPDVHVVTPFFRWENYDALSDYLSKENVMWHPVMDRPFSDDRTWICPIHTSVPAGWHPGSWKTKTFIDTVDTVDDDYYHVLCDDDLCEDGFYDKIRSCSEDVVVVSLKRGARPSVSTGVAHGCTTLVADPKNMKRGHVSSQQYITRGRIFKTYPVDASGWADGIIAEYLYSHFPIRYEPGWYAYFNFFDKERWG